jgi:hypothetical protein
VVEGAFIFTKQLRDDLDINKQIYSDRQKKSEIELKDSKASLNNSIASKMEQINSLETQLFQSEEQNKQLLKQFNDFKKQRDISEN